MEVRKSELYKNFIYYTKITLVAFNTLPLLCHTFAPSVYQHLDSNRKKKSFVQIFNHRCTRVLAAVTTLCTCPWLSELCKLVMLVCELRNPVVDLSLAYALKAVHRRYLMTYFQGIQTFDREESNDRTHFLLGVCPQRGRRLHMRYSLLADLVMVALSA